MSELTYAIGDVHGCHDLLLDLLDGIAKHAAGRPHKLVFLGDYIDRGPDSAAVVHTVRTLQQSSPGSVICLLGNHEAMLLNAVTDPRVFDLWLRNGGDTALASFGAKSARDLPEDVVGWLKSLPTFYETGRHYFVHAGVNPAKPLARQEDRDRLWIREPFLGSSHDFGKHIVHGHTPLQSGVPDEQPYRTNLDTGAAYGGALTAGVFSDAKDGAIAYLQVSDRDVSSKPADRTQDGAGVPREGAWPRIKRLRW